MRALVLGLVRGVGCGAAESERPGSPPGEVTLASPVAASSATASASVAASAPAPVAPICAGEECWTLGVKARDKKESEAFYRAGCDQNHAKSCDFLAQMLGREGCNRSFCVSDEGIQIARKGCKLGALSGCLYVAETIKDTADKAELESLYTQGCDDSSEIIQSYSCPAAANLALAREDFEKAARISAKRCEDDIPAKGDQPVIGGSKDGCTLYGWLLATGRGVTKDVAAGRKLLRSMCGAKDEVACTRLKDLPKASKP